MLDILPSINYFFSFVPKHPWDTETILNKELIAFCPDLVPRVSHEVRGTQKLLITLHLRV